MAVVHQIAAGAAPHDAITNHLLASQQLFRSWGLESDVYASHISPLLHGRVRDVERLPAEASREDPVILHYSIDAPAFHVALEHSRKVLLHYHNITPAELLWRYAPRIAAECVAGRRKLADYATRVIASAADSVYNAKELSEAGFANPEPVGILRSALSGEIERDHSPHERTRILFVGRGVPNKAQHDLIYALAALLETGHDAELWLLGSWDVAPLYRRHCARLANGLGIDGRVEFVEGASHEELSRRYASADVFVCLSDHEGFCVPVLEAMEAGLPIVAFASSAVPETVGEAGIVLPDKTPSLVAEAILMAISDPALRRRFADARAERLAHFAPEAVSERLNAFLAPIL